MLISNDAYFSLKEAVGTENISMDPAVLDTYAWQPTINNEPAKWVFRPIAVVLPGSTEEVQKVVKVCNKYGIRFKAFSTGWGIYSAPTADNVVQIDLRRMNRIREIDEKNMYAVVEPYVCGAQLQAEAMKLGLNTHITGAGPACSPLASATSGWGVGWDCISMSSSARNVMGVEWVLPDGELLRLGSPGSDLGWFSGDGPGPSLRGIMRGAGGALSGLGVFTRVAIKLFNWPGSHEFSTEGLLLDNRIMEKPSNFRFHLCFFPDSKSLTDATYKIGDEEIGYIFFRTSAIAYLYSAVPHMVKKISGLGNLRKLFDNSLKWSFTMVLAGSTVKEIEFQEEVLETVIKESGGISLEMLRIPVIGSMLLMNFLRVSAIPMVFRMGGCFNTVLTKGDSWENQLKWEDTGMKVKKKWRKDGSVLDDLGDNPFMALYENNTWAHCENIIQFDASDEKHLQALDPLFFEFTTAAVEKCVEPLSATDARQRKLLSPIMGNYNKWQKAVSSLFDPKKAADTGMYCDEADYNYEKYDPGMVEKMKLLLRERNWMKNF